MTHRMIVDRQVSCTLLFLCFCAPIIAGAETVEPSPDLRDEVAAHLQTFTEALTARDFSTLEAMLAEDFSYREPGSPVLDKAALLERERRGASAGPVSEIDYTVLSAKEENGRISADVEMVFETRLPQDGETVLFSGSIAQTVLVVREPTGLKFLAVDVESQTLYRNGEPVGAEAIEEMHAGPQE